MIYGDDRDDEGVLVDLVHEPVVATVGAVVAVWDDWSISAVIGQRSHQWRSGSSWVWSTQLDEETGAVPFAIVTDKVGDIGVAIEVICESTERAVDLWRAETHAKLVQAWLARSGPTIPCAKPAFATPTSTRKTRPVAAPVKTSAWSRPAATAAGSALPTIIG